MTWKKWFRNSLITGLVLVAPLVITVIILQVLLGWLTGFVRPLVEATDLARFTADIAFFAQVLALVLLFLLIVLIGLIAQWSLGQRLFGGIGRLVKFVPMVRVIYASIRQVSDSLMSSQSRYESTVLVEYPRTDMYAIGFVTGESPDPVETVTGHAYNVYIPNSPNPTNGHLAMVPEEQVYEIDMPARRGIRLMVTTGMAETKEDLEKLEDKVDGDFENLIEDEDDLSDVSDPSDDGDPSGDD